MSEQDFYHNPQIVQTQNAPPSPIPAAQSAIGMVVVSDDADDETFAENTPVLIEDDALIAKAGDSGSLAPAMEAIYGQGIVPQLCIVRAKSDNAGDVAAAVTALGRSQNTFEVIPEIIGAPGLDSDPTVKAEMIKLANGLGGFVYAAVSGETPEAVVAARQHFDSSRMMLLYADLQRGEQTVNGVATALGLRAAIDIGPLGRVKTLSNVPLADAFVQTEPPLSITSPVDHFGRDSVGNYLNANHVSTFLRRNGICVYGNRTCSVDPMWIYESAQRMADFVGKLIRRHEERKMDHSVSRQLIEHRVEMAQLELDTLVDKGWLYPGAQIGLHPDPKRNTKAGLKTGKTWLYGDFTVPPPNEQPGVVLRITHDYLINVLPATA